MIPTQKEVLESHPQGKTQKELIKNFIEKNKSITTMEAFTKYQITRLSEYIRQLRNDGLNISTIWTKSNGKRYGIYTLNE